VEVPEFFASEEPAVVEATRESARANYVFAFGALRQGRDVPGTTLPAAAAEEARVAAEMGISLEGVLRTYYVGHSTALEFILDEVERIGLDPPTRTAVLQLTSRYTFRYIERISVLVTDEYGRARQAQLRSRDRRRVRLVRDLLEGLPGNAEGLGYPLSCWHVAAIAWGEQPDAAIGELAKTLEGSPLTVAGPLGTLWGWIAAKAHEVEARLERFEPPPGTQVALGVPGHGRAGFRRSHEQAQEARSVALRTGEPVTRWREVALEARTLHDEEAARAFVREEPALSPATTRGRPCFAGRSPRGSRPSTAPPVRRRCSACTSGR
jgi:hypothetical protein